MRRNARGFTLIEVLITVAIVGILTAVALPGYNAYIMRGRVHEAFAALGTVQITAEQFWSNTRSYANLAPLPTTTNFTYALTTGTVSTYTVTATGVGKLAGFVYTIDQAGNRATTGVPSGWTSNSTCWVDRRSGACAQ